MANNFSFDKKKLIKNKDFNQLNISNSNIDWQQNETDENEYRDLNNDELNFDNDFDLTKGI